MNYSSTIKFAALAGAIAVALGAFGAHGLKSIVSAERLENWETASRYQFYHVFALLITGLMQWKFDKPRTALRNASYAFIAGILFFSGSLYLISLHEVLSIPLSLLGPITPLGGVCFILGWIFLFAGIRNTNKN